MKTYEGLTKPLGELLLAPTKIYAHAVAEVMKESTIKGITHITGGGFYENFPRVLPSGYGVQLDQASWETPEIFPFLQAQDRKSTRLNSSHVATSYDIFCLRKQ